MRRLVVLNIIRFLTTKEYIPQCSPGHVKKAKKEQKFYFALPPGCLPVYAFSVTHQELIDTFMLLHHWLHTMGSLTLPANYILGLVYSTA